jgi:hypothetical protein
MDNQITTEPTDADVMGAIMNAFGHTPATVEEKTDQINLALSTNDAAMAAAVVFDQAKDCKVPKPEDDPEANDGFRTLTWPRSVITDPSNLLRRWGNLE